MANENRWCFSWFAALPGANTTRAALQKSAKWKSRDTITVTFLSGDKELQRRVREMALQWVAPRMAVLGLTFVTDKNAMIRIAFDRSDGSWSSVGTTCRQVRKPKPTMNFGWIDAGSPEEDLRAVVLHEFGHALGLIHEHESPAGGIQWNRQAVIDDLRSEGWSDEDIQFNMFEAHSTRETNYTALDKKSIMMYPIPTHWTTDGFCVGFNSTLSPTDKKFIREQYAG